MKNTVRVSAEEVAVIVAQRVMERPENRGRVLAAVETAADTVFEGMNIVTFDTMQHAQEYGKPAPSAVAEDGGAAPRSVRDAAS